MTSEIEPVRLMRTAGKRRRISVAVILALSFGTLVFLSVGGVLALTIGANVRNTLDLLRGQAALLVDAMEDALGAEMARAESAVDGVSALYAQGDFGIDDSGAMSSVLAGALSAAGHANAILICKPDNSCRGVAREAGGGFRVLPVEAEKGSQVAAALEQRRQANGRRWGAFLGNRHGLFAHVSTPLSRRGGPTDGWVIAAVELRRLSEITRSLSARFGTHAFILDGNDRVIADQRLADPAAAESGITPLMPVAAYGDPVLAAYPAREIDVDDGNDGDNIDVAEISVDGGKAAWWSADSYVSITRNISGYGDRPWTIGAYFQGSQIGGEVQRVVGSALLGLAGMVVAIIVAILLGKRLSLPIRTIAGQASRVADFDLDEVAPLPRSRIKELDDQASAFNTMLVGLRAFSTYIPRSLVAKLVRSGEIGIAAPRETIVTVMFTDIANFTALSERMDAAAVAQLLNRHFAILCRAVDGHGGTVDKFLGDGMMAFFGAPDRLKGHAAAAVRAAAQIRDDLAADNQRALAEGQPRLRVRIGIHTGPVIVGNIGASDRVNYTIIGDTVNVSQRLQGLGKELAPEAHTPIAISAETAARLDQRFAVAEAGRHRLRGRGEPVDVFLVGDIADSLKESMQRAGAA